MAAPNWEYLPHWNDDKRMNLLSEKFDRKLGLAVLLTCLPLTLQAEQRTLNDGIYTEEQAEAGEALYADQCIACHDKKYFRPVLKRWAGQSLGVFYTVMFSSMPESNPGSLALDDYADIMAYILSLSRYPEGDTELASEPEAMNEITIVNRK